MNIKNKKIIAGVVVAVILLLVGLISLRRGQAEKKDVAEIPTEGVIPTVDSSVIVELKPGARKGEALLSIKNAPSGTKGIEYTLSYDAQGTGEEGDSGAIPQGAIGKCDKTGSDWECGEPSPQGRRKIVLGTCSSGVCRYHVILGKIKVELKFSGSYGEKAFEKEYSL